jgi:BirA family transcriptional regulator, biotin operon repressor / biotin---[acetyl-CoA-carboxylase] ligase
LDLNLLASQLTACVMAAFEAFVSEKHRDRFADLWLKADILRGQRISVLQGDTRIEGTAAGVDDEGALLLREEAGTLRRFRAGEVTLEKKAL